MSDEEKTLVIPPLHLDCTAFDLVFTKNSRPDRIQIITGNIDGTLRLYTAKSRDQIDSELAELKEEKNTAQLIAKDVEKDVERAAAADLDVSDQEELDELSDTDLYGEDGYQEEEESSDEEEVDPYELDWALQQTKKGSIRAMAQVPQSNALLSVTSVGTFGMCDMEVGKFVFERVQKIPTAFEKLVMMSENVLATGDDDGHVCMWDIRDPRRTAVTGETKNSKAVLGNSTKSKDEGADMWITHKWEHHDHADYISGLKYRAAKQEIVASSGDGHISIYDARAGRFLHATERLKAEILSLELAMDDELIVYGYTNGFISSAWREKFEAYGDVRLKRGGIDYLLRDPNNPSYMYSACEDGTIVAIDIESTRYFGVLGIHRAPISVLVADPASSVVACASKDYAVRFWDTNNIERVKRPTRADDGEDSDDMDEEDAEENFDAADFSESEEGEHDDSDSEDDASLEADSDDEKAQKAQKAQKSQKPQPKKVKVEQQATQKQPSKKSQPKGGQTNQKQNQGFFDGL